MSANVIPRPAETPYTTTQTGISASGNGPQFSAANYTEIDVYINVTAFTGTSMTISLQALDAFGNWLSIATSNTINGLATLNFTVGRGTSTNSGFGDVCRIQWSLTAVSNTTFTVTTKAKY